MFTKSLRLAPIELALIKQPKSSHRVERIVACFEAFSFLGKLPPEYNAADEGLIVKFNLLVVCYSKIPCARWHDIEAETTVTQIVVATKLLTNKLKSKSFLVFKLYPPLNSASAFPNVPKLTFAGVPPAKPITVLLDKSVRNCSSPTCFAPP